MRSPLILAAIGLIAALIVLFVLADSDDSSTSSAKVHSPIIGHDETGHGETGNTARASEPLPDRKLSSNLLAEQSTPAASPSQGSAVKEMIASDGTRVRDNRSGDAPMRDPDAPFRRPLSTTRLNPTLASKMGAVLRKEAVRCQQEHHAEIGEAARVQPRATFSVQEERLVVSDVEISLTNIDKGGEFESCLRSAVLGLSVDAPGHPDIKQHSMMVPFSLKPSQ